MNDATYVDLWNSLDSGEFETVSEWLNLALGQMSMPRPQYLRRPEVRKYGRMEGPCFTIALAALDVVGLDDTQEQVNERSRRSLDVLEENGFSIEHAFKFDEEGQPEGWRAQDLLEALDTFEGMVFIDTQQDFCHAFVIENGLKLDWNFRYELRETGDVFEHIVFFRQGPGGAWQEWASRLAEYQS